MLCMALALFGLNPMLGQTGGGTIQGTVKDAQGAIVPGAKIMAVHVQTGREYKLESNDSGIFLLPGVQIGSYRLIVTSVGMQTWEGDLLLQVNQSLSVNVTLQVGSTATSILVAGDVTPVVVDTNATLGNTLERKRLDELPLNGRFLQNLIPLTTPGIEGDGYTMGLISQSTAYTQDGASLENREQGNLHQRPPGLDTVSEVRVETSGSSAEFSRAANVIISTKSGTNNFHGAVFATNRNNGWGLARRREDTYLKAPKLIRNEYGISAGGPVRLPKLYDGRNRTFFFFGYEKYDLRQEATVSVTMPTAAMRAGDFSGLVNAAGQKITLYNPFSTGSGPTYTRLPFPNNQIPANMQSPVSKYVFAQTPLPTRSDVNPLVSANYEGPAPSPTIQDTWTGRLDHNFTDNDRVFFRYSYGNSDVTLAPRVAPMLNGAGGVTYTPAYDRSGVVSYSRVLSPTFFSETTFSIGYEAYLVYSGRINENWTTQLGLPNPFGTTGFPAIATTGFSQEWRQMDNYRDSRTWVANLDQKFTKTLGRHELRFGGQMRHSRNFWRPDSSPFAPGGMNFSVLATGQYNPASGALYSPLPQTGFAGASLFLGLPDFYQAIAAPPMFYEDAPLYSGYFQDNFKLSSNLTLNLGFRYEFEPALNERRNLLQGFDTATKSILLGQPLDKMIRQGLVVPQVIPAYEAIGVKFATSDRDMIKSNPYGFQPRLGFAYRTPTGRRPVVIRGGFGMFDVLMAIRQATYRMSQAVPHQPTFTTSFTSAQLAPDGLPNLLLRSAPQYVAGVNTREIIPVDRPVGIAPGSPSVYYWDPEQPMSRAYQYSVTAEREMYRDMVFRLSFTGAHGRNLDQWWYMNQPVVSPYVWFVKTGTPLPTGTYANTATRPFDQTTYGTIARYQRTGYTNYNSFVLEVNKRFSRGYAFQAFYNLANSFRIGGNGWRDSPILSPDNFLPGSVPTDPDAFNRFYNYQRDTTVPKHRVNWNFLADVPAGRGKLLGRNAGRFLNSMIAGWQLAGYGAMRSRYWALGVNNWGSVGQVEVYGRKYPIQDCRGGACFPGYLYYNGWIPPTQVNSTNAQGARTGVCGVPSNYKPASTPVHTDPRSIYYNTNNVFVTLRDGTQQLTALTTGLHPWRQQYIPGPWEFVTNASLFRRFDITERVALRFNLDAFNVFNAPGLALPDGNTGILSLRASSNAPRQLQATLRLTW